MKPIVYVVTSLKRGGPVNFLFDLVKHLDLTKFKPQVIVLCEADKNSRSLDFADINVEVFNLNMPRGFMFFKALFSIKSLIKEINPAVVHCIGFRADMLGLFLLPMYPKVSSQLNYPYDDYVLTYGRFIGGLMAFLTIVALRLQFTAIACSKDISQKLSAKSVVSNVIYNSIDPSHFFRSLTKFNKLDCRKDLGVFPDADLVFIFVGVFSERKRPKLAVESFLKFERDHPNAVLLMVGDGPLRPGLMEISRGHRIIFYGNVPDTRPYLAASDIYLASSIAEGFPLSVLEGMAMGLPVILSDIPAHQEILYFNKSAGYIFKQDSIHSAASAMSKIACSNYDEMSNASKCVVDSWLNSKIMCETYQSIYTKIT